MDHKAVLSRVPYEYAFEFPDFPLAVKPRFGTLAPEMHIHERFCEIVLIVSGATVHHCEKHTYPIHSQEIFVIDPGMCHCYEESDVGYYNILVDLNTLKLPLYNLTETAGYRNLFVLGPRSHLVEEGTPVRNFLSSGQFSECVTLLQQMCDLQTVRNPGWQFAMLSLFTDFLRVVCGIGEGGSVPVESAPPHLIADIAMHITRHCQEPWPIERLCKVCKLSRAVFSASSRNITTPRPAAFSAVSGCARRRLCCAPPTCRWRTSPPNAVSRAATISPWRLPDISDVRRSNTAAIPAGQKVNRKRFRSAEARASAPLRTWMKSDFLPPCIFKSPVPMIFYRLRSVTIRNTPY